MIRASLCVALLACFCATAGAVPPRELARAIEQADDRRYREAGETFRILLDAEPGSIPTYLALYEMAGIGTEDGRLHPRPAAAAVRGELSRLGNRVPLATRRYLDAYLAGPAISLQQLRESVPTDAWGCYLRIRRHLHEPLADQNRIIQLVDRAWNLSRNAPLAFYLADRISFLVRLPIKVRESFRGWAREQARRICPRLVPRYLLPYRRPESGLFGKKLVSATRYHEWSEIYRHTYYVDDLRYYCAGAAKAHHPNFSRQLLTRLVQSHEYHGCKLSAYRALYFLLAEQKRWKQLVVLARALQLELKGWPYPRRIRRDCSSYAFNNPGDTHFLIGLAQFNAGNYAEAIARYELGIERAGVEQRGVPANIYRELSAFYRGLGDWGRAFWTFDTYRQLTPEYEAGTWFELYLRAAPVFVLSLGITSLHLFLLMLTAGVLLFSRAGQNRPHFRFALALAVIYTAGQWYMFSRFDFSGQRALSLALAVGAMIFMPIATGRVHHRRVVAPPGRIWALALEVLVVGLLMAGYTWLLLRFWSFRPSPFMRFLDDLPMVASVAEALSGASDKWFGVLLVTLAALQEEVLYRGFTLPILATYFSRGEERVGAGAWWSAQLITASLWAMAHAGMTHPQAWKFVQVAGLSLVLGELFRRRGLAPCIVAHGLFNVCAILLRAG